jgi:hypothetical protein
MLDYEQIEDDFVELLSELEDVEVVALANSEAAFTKTFTNKITVAYSGSEYASPEGMGNIVQREEVEVVLFFESRKTRGDKGIYKTMSKAKEKALGFAPDHCGKAYLKKQTPLKRDDDIFSFTQIYGCFSVVTETLSDDDGEELSGITFERN